MFRHYLWSSLQWSGVDSKSQVSVLIQKQMADNDNKHIGIPLIHCRTNINTFRYYTVDSFNHISQENEHELTCAMTCGSLFSPAWPICCVPNKRKHLYPFCAKIALNSLKAQTLMLRGTKIATLTSGGKPRIGKN